MEQRQLPIETETHAAFEILLGRSGKISDIEGTTTPQSWRHAATALKGMRTGKVIVLGSTDAGKSTLCTYLVNKLLNEVGNLQIIDADVGQTDVGPPTTIARARPLKPIASLPELQANAGVFIGHTTPSYVQGKLIRGIQKLLAESERSLTIINTDGWIGDRDAIRYKIDLITQVSPELVVGLEYRDELQPILTGAGASSMRVDSARNTYGRSRAGRRSIRASNYRRFLEGAVTRSVNLQNVQLSFPTGFSSATPHGNRILRNLIIGLVDEDGYLLEIGILVGIGPHSLRIFSRPTNEIRRIDVGYVKISPYGREIGFL